MRPLSEIVQVKANMEAQLLHLPGVTGVDVGFKYVAGQKTNEIAIRVLVEQKRDVPEAERVPDSIGGIATDVIERRFELHRAERRRAVEDIQLMADTTTYDPLKGGISIGPCRSIGGFVYTGTLGAIVRDNVTGNPLLLSNFHVMCVDSGWSVGDTMTQPSRVDTGTCPGGLVGTLERAVLNASVDAAVSTLSGRGYSCEIVDIGTVTGTTAATLGMGLRKRGRTTGLSYGAVDSISLSVNVDYGDGIGVQTLTNQIGIAPDTARNAMFGDRGDSGSVVVNDARQVVGLYFAGGSDGYGVANPIAAVLSALNISMCVASPKSIIKDTKDGKIEKLEIKEFKREKLEIKERKIEKFEVKEFKREKLEIKERKPEKFEVEGTKRIGEFPPKISEVGQPGRPPVLPGQPGGRMAAPGQPEGLEGRIEQIEAAIGELATFITPDLRPNLNAGALMQEPDLTNADIVAMSAQLEKDAADAAQSKINFDTNMAGS